MGYAYWSKASLGRQKSDSDLVELVSATVHIGRMTMLNCMTM